MGNAGKNNICYNEHHDKNRSVMLHILFLTKKNSTLLHYYWFGTQKCLTDHKFNHNPGWPTAVTLGILDYICWIIFQTLLLWCQLERIWNYYLPLVGLLGINFFVIFIPLWIVITCIRYINILSYNLLETIS